MLEIVEREEMGRRGCAQAHACPLGRLNALGAGQHGLGGRDNPGASRPGSAACPTEACRALFESFGNCVLKMLAEGVSSARLETRTKESNVYASWWVVNP